MHVSLEAKERGQEKAEHGEHNQKHKDDPDSTHEFF